MSDRRRRRLTPTDEQLVELRFRAKAELRKRLLAVRRAVPKDKRAERSAKIAAHVIAHPAFVDAKVIAAYVAMRGEVDPAPIVEAARAAGKRVALPRVDYEREAMTLHEHAPDAPLEESGMGFFQPPETAPPVASEDVDLVLVPAVAADLRGHRVGFGKAFYDGLLRDFGDAKTIALVFDFQLLTEVPDTPNDVAVDFVATDDGVHAREG